MTNSLANGEPKSLPNGLSNKQTNVKPNGLTNGHKEDSTSPQIANLRSLVSSITSALDTLDSNHDPEVQSQTLIQIAHLSRRLDNATKTPADAMADFTFRPLANSCVRIALALNFFDHLPGPDHAVEGINIDKLAALTETDPVLTERIVRVLLAFDVIQEDETTGLYRHTLQSQAYTDPGLRTYAIWMWDVMISGATAGIGPYFERAARPVVNPTGGSSTPFGLGHGDIAEEFFQTLERIGKQDLMKEAMAGSSVQTAREAVEAFDFAGLPPGQDNVVLVDVGGAKGATIAELRRAGVKGHMVLQDLSSVLESGILPNIDVETVAYDFFNEEQPVHGASAYLYQRIFHDWSDEDCVKILDSLRPAMGKDSKLLVCEVVLQDSNPHPRKTLRDLNMLTIGGKERSQAQWRTLLEEGGFRVEKFHALHNTDNSIIEARLSKT